MTRQKFAKILDWGKMFTIFGTPGYLEFLAGKRELPCSAWAIPTYNVRGWKAPCYAVSYTHLSGQRSQLMADLQRMETEAQKNPTNFQNILTLCSLYQQMHQAARVTNLLQQTLQFADQALADPNITYANVGALAQICAELGNLTKLEPVLHKLIALAPGQPEPRFDLAALECVLGSQTQALQDLKACLLYTSPFTIMLTAASRRRTRST